MKVAYVYLGETQLPKYVLENLDNTRIKFPHVGFVFISDNASSIERVKSLGIDVWQCSNQANSNSEALGSMSHPMEFRSGFWFNTLARFFALEEFMEASGEKEILQIEADVWLSQNFPFKKFEALTEALAYPMESAARGAASVLYIGSIGAIKHLNNFCKLELKLFPKATDMTLLGSYREKYPNRVTVLPSGHNTLFFKESTPDYISSEGSSKVAYFGGIFDPLTYGMHLLGIDPKNNRGVLKLYVDPHHHAVEIQALEFVFLDQVLQVKNDSVVTPLFNLHVHSKNMKMFRNQSSTDEIMRHILMRKPFEVNQIIWRIFWLMGLQKLKKVLRRIKVHPKKYLSASKEKE